MEQRPPQQPPRHEQPDSDWRDFIESISPWWEKYGNVVMIVITVVVVGFAAYTFMSQRASQAYENAFADLATTTSPEGLGNVAVSNDVPTVQALARLRQGDLYLHKAITADEDQANGSPPSDSGAEQPPEAEADERGNAGAATALTDLSSAAAAYQKVLDQAPAKVYKLNALLGLASVAESRKQWDKAHDHYQRLIDMAGDRYPVITGRAQRRMALLPQLAQAIAFAPDEKKSESESPKPKGETPGPPPAASAAPSKPTPQPPPKQSGPRPAAGEQ